MEALTSSQIDPGSKSVDPGATERLEFHGGERNNDAGSEDDACPRVVVLFLALTRSFSRF